MENSGFVCLFVFMIDSFFDDNDDNFRMKLCCVRVSVRSWMGVFIRSFHSGFSPKVLLR